MALEIPKKHGRMPDFPKLPPSGIKVIIVGAGFAGLSAAIECDRKGHSVTLFEKVDQIEEITHFGDIISFDPNGSRIFEQWPGVIDAMNRVIRHTTWLDYYKWNGGFQTRQSFVEEKKWGRRLVKIQPRLSVRQEELGFSLNNAG